MTMKKIPYIGLGTWNLRGDECVSLVSKALDIGYSHIDTAHNYDNQPSVAKALKGRVRDEIFITSKVMLSQGKPYETCEISLKELSVDYLDLFLIHWPDRSQNMEEVIEKMEKLKQEGKILRYGVSNFTISHLQDMINMGAQMYANQVEFHPYLDQKQLHDFCQKNSIELIAYRPLGKGALLGDPVIREIAESIGKSPSQVLLRWQIQKGVAFVVKASTEERLRENFHIEDFVLTDAHMKKLETLNKGHRFCDTSWSDFEY